MPHASRTARTPLAGSPIATVLATIASTTFAFASAGVAEETSKPQPATPELESVYDPYRGMERNGRIPMVEKAKYVDHPERWRYIPEGRLKPGNFFERFLVSSFAVPLFFHNADVGTGAGLGITDIDFRQKRRREFLGAFLSYTTEGQQSYTLRWRRWLKHLEVPEGGVLQEERSYLTASGGYRKTLTRRFYGIGPTTNKRDQSSYTDEVGFFDVGLSHSLPGKALDDFIVASGLDKYRGQIAPRNAFNSPWVTAADLRLSQEIPAFFDSARAVVTLDIRNVANLINKDWGQLASVQFPYVAPVLNATINPATGRYTYSPLPGRTGPAPANFVVSPAQASVWQMQLGVRFEF